MDRVRIVMLDVEDRRPVEDILFTDEDYTEAHRRAGLALLETYRPLAKPSESYRWVSETTIAPWVIYLLGDDDAPALIPRVGPAQGKAGGGDDGRAGVRR